MNFSARAAGFAFAVLVLVWVVGLSLVLGKDLNWDFMNYHYYGAYQFLENRLDTDYYAASFQSYLNPLAHVPHFLMIRAGWNSVVIGMLLAAFHALNLYFVWRIARAMLPHERIGQQRWPMLAVLLALLAPLFITTVGSSFSDPSTSVFVMAGAWYLLRDCCKPVASRAVLFFAGCLLGLSAGLKLTNSVLALSVAIPVAVYWLWVRAESRLARVAILSAGLALGVALGHGYWSWRLMQAFGNPVFPMFNNIFQSPDFPPVSYRDTRFMGALWTGLLTLPFEMVAPISWLYAENIVVDLRFVAFIALLLAALPLAGLSGWRPRPDATVAPTQVPTALKLVTAIFVLAYLSWGLTSRIGRYALLVWLLLGPLMVAWALVIIRRQDVVMTLGLGVAALQGFALVEAGNPRWNPNEWQREWLSVKMSPELQNTPITLLILGKQTNAAIVPFFHRDTQAANLVGQYIQPAGDRMPPRLKRLLSEPGRDFRVTFADTSLAATYDGRLLLRAREDVDRVVSSYGFKLTADECQPVTTNVAMRYSDDGPIPAAERPGSDRRSVDRLHVCKLTRLGADELAREHAERAVINTLFDAVERACAPALNPVAGESLHGRHGWMRIYFNSLHTLMTNGSSVVVRPFYSMVDVDLGSFESWQRSPPPACPKLPSSVQRPS